MSNAKANILSRLAQANSTKNISSSSVSIQAPQRSKQRVIAQLIEQLKYNAAHVVHSSEETIVQDIESFFTANKLEKQLLTNIDIKDLGKKIEVTTGIAKGNELVGLSQADCGISETGTLVLRSSQENPTSINFLVDWHLVLLKENAIVENLNEAISTLKQNGLANSRALNFISGPSRTADIEQTIQLGAHGPRHLWVFIMKEG